MLPIIDAGSDWPRPNLDLASTRAAIAASAEADQLFEVESVPLWNLLARPAQGEKLRQQVVQAVRVHAFALNDFMWVQSGRALRAASQFTPGTNLKAWLFRILRNTWLSLARRRRIDPTVGDAPENAYGSPRARTSAVGSGRSRRMSPGWGAAMRTTRRCSTGSTRT